jgi:predicted membrane protein
MPKFLNTGVMAFWLAMLFIYLFIYFILRHGARGLRPKDEKESKKVETATAAKETRKRISK